MSTPSHFLIYDRIAPVSKTKHKDWSVSAGEDFSFAKSINSVPLTTLEFSSASMEYPIIFTGDEDEVMPAAILGVSDYQNLYVKETGAWKTKYIPAYLRRYPFIFSKSEDQQRLTLCIDEAFSGCNQNAKGERLFNNEGEKTSYLESVLYFNNKYQGAFVNTQNFCRKLKDFNLLDVMNAELTFSSGHRVNLSGFQAISRDRLKKLADEALLSMLKSDELEFIYLHLNSIKNFALMIDRVTQQEINENTQDIIIKTGHVIH